MNTPECHFTPMEYCVGDNGDGVQVEFWMCMHCGHTLVECETAVG